MKSKMMIMFVVLTAILFMANYTFAQVSNENKDCKKKCETECTKKIGDSQGMMTDSAKVCPVSGEKLDGAEGDPVKYTYLGKEYTFCCAGCVKKFKAEPMNYIKEEINCPVMGETADKTVSTTVDGVKYYFCCSGCIKKFEKDPQKYLNKK